MESKPMFWSHLMLLLLVLVSLHRCSHAQPVTSSTWASSTMKDTLMKTQFSVLVIAFLSSIIFMIFFSLMVRHCADTCASPRTHVSPADVERRRRHLIDQCPVLVYSEVKELRIGNSVALECAVCLTEFEDTDKIRLLPRCNHVFHTDCIDRWFASRLTCPVCRAQLTPSDSADNAVTESNHDDESSAAAGEEIDRQSTVEMSSEPPPEEIIDVDDESGRSTGAPTTVSEPGIRSITTAAAAAERFGRSHSTGHSLFMEREGMMERYTLRLPEHVRKEIFERERKRLRRCLSSNDVVLRGEWSLKRGSGDNMERWVLLSMMPPPFVSKDWSSLKKSPELNTDQSSSSSSPLPRLPV